MSVRERILALKLVERAKKNDAMVKELGINVKCVERTKIKKTEVTYGLR